MKLKVKRMIISPLALINFMTKDTCWRVVKGLPKSVKLAGFTLDPATQNLVLFVQDDSFDEVDVHEEIAPLFVTEFRKVQ
jgi:hypothetical protein